MDFSKLTDIELIKKFLLGDEEAWEYLMDKYWGIMFGLCKRNFENLREENVNIALIHTFGNAVIAIKKGKFDIKGRKHKKENRFFSWLCEIAINECRKMIHNSKIWKESFSIHIPISQEEGNNQTYEDILPDPAELQDREYEKEEIRLIVNDCINKFKDATIREIFTFRFEADFNLAEISKILGIPDSTIRSKYNNNIESFKICLRRKGLTYIDDSDEEG